MTAPGSMRTSSAPTSLVAGESGLTPVFQRSAPEPAVLHASAIFICFNQQDSVAEAFDSLLAQTVPLEIVPSDDASTDGTFEILRARVGTRGHTPSGCTANR